MAIKDNVNRPDHYITSGLECLDVIKAKLSCIRMGEPKRGLAEIYKEDITQKNHKQVFMLVRSFQNRLKALDAVKEAIKIEEND